MNIFDYIILYSLIIIWIIILINVILVIGGYFYYLDTIKFIDNQELDEYPFVSVLVPAHNEGKVIEKTARALLAFNYPKDKYEIIIINDNSSDNSAEILSNISNEFNKRNFIVINTDKRTGGKGKSTALNIGFERSKGEIIAVYDADNTPEKDALKHLVKTLIKDNSLGAVIGKFRCRNKEVNLLTKFINIETLTFQWMAQAGRWKLFNLCTIPGTNFVIRRSILEEINGWDTKAITEDTELSFRIYRMGYKIKFMPIAVTWEQEPQTLNVWFKQRSRWAKGNIYVVLKNFKYLFDKSAGATRFDILYYILIYAFFLSATIISDILFIFGAAELVTINIIGYNIILWILAYSVFVFSILVAISTEKGELTFSNFLVVLAMYFTYCKLWGIVAAIGFYNYIKDVILKREAKWYKTERF
ncbi:glycosyltransferase family 2 protein [Clostridium sp. Sa3CUN1]|uniref:Glycosyltransferase family 2 protein n=1 Tax=Clostridium gallinarum TaxID=2762246 RepID=A0ABR8Q6P1_9CLOT|nr:glycosyltransferase [Clostridium gallinarum]MBD7916099.1 glycosyltransferase family 2 protein [Clostridium gallinarum]